MAAAGALGLFCAVGILLLVSGTADRYEGSRGWLAPDGNPAASWTTWRYWLDTRYFAFIVVAANSRSLPGASPPSSTGPEAHRSG